MTVERAHRDTTEDETARQARDDALTYTDVMQTQRAVVRIANSNDVNLPTLSDGRRTDTQIHNRGRTGIQ